MNEYNISLPGRIVTYDAATQTATIKICAESLYSSSKVSDKLAIRQDLTEVPVHTPSGGGWAITMPIAVGDTCIIFFSQIGYDHWLFDDLDEGGQLLGRPAPHLRRHFHEDDGYALVGLNTIPRAIASYSTDGSQWRNSDATQFIHLKDDLSIVVDSPTSVTINAPAVIVNCDTATVDATASVGVTCATATVDATASMTVTTAAFNVTSPLSTFSGLVSCAGIGAGVAPVAGKAAVSGNLEAGGDVEATGDVKAGAISLSTHTHLAGTPPGSTGTPS